MEDRAWYPAHVAAARVSPNAPTLTLCKYITEEGSDPRASVCMEMSGFHPGSQMLLYTFPGGRLKKSLKTQLSEHRQVLGGNTGTVGMLDIGLLIWRKVWWIKTKNKSVAGVTKSSFTTCHFLSVLHGCWLIYLMFVQLSITFKTVT